jgi:outer membrane lipoprotein-sorting protein
MRPPSARVQFVLCWLGALASALLAVLVLDEPSVQAQGLEEVYDCASRNLPPAAHAHAQLVTSRGGKSRTVDVEYWSRTSPEGTRNVVVARQKAPKGEIAAYLVSDGDAIGEAWTYTPAKKKPERLELKGGEVRMFGTNVTLEDFARFGRVLFPGQVRRMADADVGGRQAYVVETKPSPGGGSEYSRIVTSIDKEWCSIVRRESYEARFEKAAKPRKLYSVEPADMKVQGGFSTPLRARLDDAKDGSSTTVQVTELELPAQLDDAQFTPDALSRAAR